MTAQTIRQTEINMSKQAHMLRKTGEKNIGLGFF